MYEPIYVAWYTTQFTELAQIIHPELLRFGEEMDLTQSFDSMIEIHNDQSVFHFSFVCSTTSSPPWLIAQPFPSTQRLFLDSRGE